MIAGWFRSTYEATNISFLCSPGDSWSDKSPQTNHLASGDDCELSGASRAFFFRSGDERWMKGVAKKKGGCGFHPFPCGVFFFFKNIFLVHLKIGIGLRLRLNAVHFLPVF